MKVRDAMHKGVEWVSPDTSVIELAKLMCGYDIGAIPIGESDKLIGMVRIATSSVAGWRLIISMRPRNGTQCDDSRYSLLPGG